MVRFLPPQLSRLLTIALQAGVHKDGLAPSAVGAPSAGASWALAAVPDNPLAMGGPYRAPLRRAGRLPPKRYTFGVRTAQDDAVPADEALQKLIDGNKRFLAGKAETWRNVSTARLKALAAFGQKPMAAVVGCADSRAPVELLFDAPPGEIFVLRNAGNTLSNAEGSFVGSLEFSVNALGVKLIVFLGHTQCGAIKGATARTLATKGGSPVAQKALLDRLLVGLSPVVEQAWQDLGGEATEEEIATAAVEVNVMAGIQKLVEFSDSIRAKVKTGEVQVHGAVFDIETGKVKFLGEHPNLAQIIAAASKDDDKASAKEEAKEEASEKEDKASKKEDKASKKKDTKSKK
mmetsp:Transcript_67362/g.195073  ORF Transcript_67362/g.195073 Transcript_67362/m.195073 type:complete len:347 (+) Transcript_67362:66-1106(+)